MSGSLNQWRVAEIIRLSQQQWRKGYDLGKSGATMRPAKLETMLPEFREGYLRGRDEYLGIPKIPLPRAPRRMSEEENAKIQAERGRHLAKTDLCLHQSEDLDKCHPAFIKAFWEEYHRLVDTEEDLY
jgi:hypothetical protein